MCTKVRSHEILASTSLQQKKEWSLHQWWWDGISSQVFRQAWTYYRSLHIKRWFANRIIECQGQHYSLQWATKSREELNLLPIVLSSLAWCLDFMTIVAQIATPKMPTATPRCQKCLEAKNSTQTRYIFTWNLNDASKFNLNLPSARALLSAN